MDIQPFTVQVPEAALADLRARLARTRWPDEVAGEWEYGTSLVYLRDLVHYWQRQVDWRAQEQVINTLSALSSGQSAPKLHVGLPFCVTLTEPCRLCVATIRRSRCRSSPPR
jgi:epoxide hydrolase